MGDLEYYNITLRHQKAAAFFGKQNLPQSQVDSEILNIENASDMTTAHNQELITLLDLAMIPTSSPGQCAVNDFTVSLFRTLQYTWGHHRVARTRKHINLYVCRKYARHDNIDVCLWDCHKSEIMLIVQDDKCFVDGPGDAEAQLIAKAVAVFRRNNHHRWETNQPQLDSQVWPSLGLTTSH